jgi:hypothetical protein
VLLSLLILQVFLRCVQSNPIISLQHPILVIGLSSKPPSRLIFLLGLSPLASLSSQYLSTGQRSMLHTDLCD